MESRSINTSEQGLLEGWIAAFRGPLIGLLASWGRDWRAAEELAQDTFAEAWVSRGRFVGDFSDTRAYGVSHFPPLTHHTAYALECAKCGSERRWIAAITNVEAIAKILGHLELPNVVMQPAPAPPQLELGFEGC
jgi:hypothetical protein